MSNYKIGTKFYRYPDGSPVPEYIRLKKITVEGGMNVYHFNIGGYTTTITREDFNKMKDSEELLLNSTYYKSVEKHSVDQNGDPCVIYSKKEMPYFDRSTRIQLFGMADAKWIFCEWRLEDETDEMLTFKVVTHGIAISEKVLKRDYTMIIPDGFLTVSNIHYKSAEGDPLADVLTTFHLGKELDPAIICRQDVFDIECRNDEKLDTGYALSIRDSAYYALSKYYLYSDKVTNFKASAMYRDDRLEDCLRYISPLNSYNRTLARLKERYRSVPIIANMHDNIYDLYMDTNLNGKIAELFGIKPFFVKFDHHNGLLPCEKIFAQVYDILNGKNFRYCIYDNTIDLDALEHYMLIYDKNYRVYVVTWDTISD